MGTDCVGTAARIGWNGSPVCYYSFSEAKAAYLRSRSIPSPAYIDDAWYGNQFSTFRCSDKEKWLFARVPSHGNVCLDFFCVLF